MPSPAPCTPSLSLRSCAPCGICGLLWLLPPSIVSQMSDASRCLFHPRSKWLGASIKKKLVGCPVRLHTHIALARPEGCPFLAVQQPRECVCGMLQEEHAEDSVVAVPIFAHSMGASTKPAGLEGLQMATAAMADPRRVAAEHNAHARPAVRMASSLGPRNDLHVHALGASPPLRMEPAPQPHVASLNQHRLHIASRQVLLGSQHTYTRAV